jgi:hypothetical protein
VSTAGAKIESVRKLKVVVQIANSINANGQLETNESRLNPKLEVLIENSINTNG